MARTDPLVNIRMPLDLRETVRARAVRNRRSLTQEIVHVLEVAIGADNVGNPHVVPLPGDVPEDGGKVTALTGGL